MKRRELGKVAVTSGLAIASRALLGEAKADEDKIFRAPMTAMSTRWTRTRGRRRFCCPS